ncbi:leukocyte elastase inhibitor-like [Puntigrus tetrazona]|uniref:leukocyte elastase inhibitor-like n=1 Tax=Puntigrus tetrazona TaxID=1606681 RepID=UPI001C8ACA1D|nr:leukocyte elastase inhibitor-like [Puntigrus tetrazona]
MNPDIEPVVLANSKFSIDLLKVLCEASTDNVIFSPLSISSALSLVLLGSPFESETAKQMFKYLHFGKMRIMTHYLYEELYQEGEYKVEGKRSLQLVNRMYGEKTIDFLDDFLDTCEEWCFTSLRCVDFKGNSEAVRTEINTWLKKIGDPHQDVLDKGDVSKDTLLALISAVYFNKKWVKIFDCFYTKKCLFSGVLCDMMGKTDKLPLGTIPHRQHGTNSVQAQILEIPYENNHLSMFIILPASRDLEKLVKLITYENIMEWTEPDNMIPTDVHIVMPIFKLEEKYDLEKALKALGMTDLFSDKCDLSGMSRTKLKLSKMLHKCVVDVNMTGTDAQGGGGAECTNALKETPYMPFIVDKPFLFFIRHNPTKSILFWGRVASLKPVL